VSACSSSVPASASTPFLSRQRKLRRVLKPGGRLVIGEHFVDPDFVSLGRLKHLTRDAGFAFERRTGPIAIYLARFCVPRPLP
jgi:hypothetical protein